VLQHEKDHAEPHDLDFASILAADVSLSGHFHIVRSWRLVTTQVMAICPSSSGMNRTSTSRKRRATLQSGISRDNSWNAH